MPNAAALRGEEVEVRGNNQHPEAEGKGKGREERKGMGGIGFLSLASDFWSLRGLEHGAFRFSLGNSFRCFCACFALVGLGRTRQRPPTDQGPADSVILLACVTIAAL